MKKLACIAAALAALVSCTPASAETTLCTEITALPFTITAQGVYCLKQNLNVNIAGFGNAITINAGNVTIDFNGFRVNNQASTFNSARGVFSEDRKNITLRNGFIRGFMYGVYLNEFATDASAGHLIEDMKIADSGISGIFVAGDKSVVRDSRVFDTGDGLDTISYGIELQFADDALVENNIVSGVSETESNSGIYVNTSARVRVIGNEIADIDGGEIPDYGIVLQSVSQAIVARNRLLNNPNTASAAIANLSGTSSNIACLDNEVGGFSAIPYQASCTTDIDNHALYD